MIRETSSKAYQEVRNGLGGKQQMVLDYISEHIEVCDQQIAAGLGWPINRVTPRRGELLEMREIVDLGVRPGPSGRGVHFWGLNPNFDQKELFVA